MTRAAARHGGAVADLLAEFDDACKLAAEVDRHDLAARLEQAAIRLRADDVTVAVVGEFKQGKSTLVNALLRTDICPVDADVVTAVPTVLRYGRLHGPGTWHERPPEELPLHVHAAAYAAFLAVETAAAGVFNVVEDDPRVSNAKARQALQWRPEFRFDRAPAPARAVLEEWPTA